nr:MAG TPA: HemY protein N-terminus [Caudoviricetes sp.]
MSIATILCILLLSLYILLALFWIVRSVIDTVDEKKRDKRNAAWETERQQLEKDRALREVEYHEARMKELEGK